MKPNYLPLILLSVTAIVSFNLFAAHRDRQLFDKACAETGLFCESIEVGQ